MAYIDYGRGIIYCDIGEVPVMTTDNSNWLYYGISCRLPIESDKRSGVKWIDIHSNVKIYKILKKHNALKPKDNEGKKPIRTIWIKKGKAGFHIYKENGYYYLYVFNTVSETYMDYRSNTLNGIYEWIKSFKL